MCELVSILGEVCPYNENMTYFVKKQTPNGLPLKKCIYHSNSILNNLDSWDDESSTSANTNFAPLFGYWTKTFVCYDTCYLYIKNDEDIVKVIDWIKNDYKKLSLSINDLKLDLYECKKELFKINASIKKSSNDSYLKILNEALNEAKYNYEHLENKELNKKIYDRINKILFKYNNVNNNNLLNNLNNHYNQTKQNIDIITSSIKNKLYDIGDIYCLGVECKNDNFDIKIIKKFLDNFSDIISMEEIEKNYYKNKNNEILNINLVSINLNNDIDFKKTVKIKTGVINK